jgi:hypothetical protein
MYMYELHTWGGVNQIDARKGLPNITHIANHVVNGDFPNIVVFFWG